jgi:nucleoside-diphosphate-sugar epimerase
VYGAGCAPGSLIGSLIAAVQRGERPALADLRPVRDYCFVEDAADGVVRAGCRDGDARAYNLASGRGVSVLEVAHTLLHVAGRADLAVRERAADRPSTALTLSLIGDPARAHDELGFAARVPLEDGLRRSFAAERRA